MAEDMSVSHVDTWPGTVLRPEARRIPGILWSTDANMRITSAFGEGLSDWSLQPDQAVGLTLQQCFQGEDPAISLIAAHRRALRGEAFASDQGLAGRTRQVRVAPLQDGEGRIVGCIGFAQDIVAQGRTEQTWRHARSELQRQLEERTAELAIANRQRDKETEERTSAEELLEQRTRQLDERSKELKCLYDISYVLGEPGISLEEVLQRTVDLIPPAWQYPEITCARIVVENRQYRTENFLETIWKQVGDIFVHGRRIGALEVCYLEERGESDEGPFLREKRSLLDEIVDRLGKTIEQFESEQTRRRSEDRFRLAFENGPLAMAFFNADGGLLDVNRALCDMLGYTREEVCGKAPNDIIHPDDLEAALTQARRIHAGELPSCTMEKRYLRKDGETIWGRVTASIVRDSEGEVMYGLAMIENITEQKLAERRMGELRAALAHMGRAATIGAMASGIAHELNQPLGAIVTRAEVGARTIELRRKETREHQRQRLESIADQAHRAGEIIRRMRNFVKKRAPHRTTVHVAELIEEVLSLVGDDLRHAGIALTCDVDRSLPTTLADKIQVQQVLLNLIRNAMEAMDGIETSARQLRIQATARDGVLEVAVRDTGCGIPDECTESLFWAFHGTKPEGMGMGLAISRSIVEDHGGRIWAAQNADRGATFTFTLPTAAGRA